MRRTVIKIDVLPDKLKFKMLEDDEVVYRTHSFLTYFYVYKDDEAIVNNLLRKFGLCQDFNNTYCKFQLNNNYDRYKCVKILDDKEVKHFESDIGADKRFLIDHQELYLGQEHLRKMFFDIETFDLNPLSQDIRGYTEGKDPVLSIAFKDFNGKKFYVYNTAFDHETRIKTLYKKYVNDRNNVEVRNKVKGLRNEIISILEKGEKQLLQEFSLIVKDYDLLFAWNGEKFDWSYLKDRFKKHGLDFDALDLMHMDYLEIYRKNSYANLQSYSLENVGKEEFKYEINKEDSKFKNLEEITKINWKEKTGLKKFFELYLFEPQLLKEYNLQDVEIMSLIEERNGFIGIHEIQSKLSHCLIRETMFNSGIGDYMILNESYKRGLVKKSKPNKVEVERRKHPVNGVYPSGGFTYCYLPGLHKYVGGFDAKSQYPCTIISFNISEETFVKTYKPDLRKVFSENEAIFLEKVFSLKKVFINKVGNLKKGTYEKKIEDLKEEYGITKTMVDFMWEWVDNYDASYLLDYCKKNHYSVTPADINYDTRGWDFHPHRFFRNDVEGVLPSICRKLITERDKLKYQLKNHDDTSSEYKNIWLEQTAYKITANSLYGIYGLKVFRDFMYDIADSITSSARFCTKSVISEARRNGFITPNGDTDSAYVKKEGVKEEDVPNTMKEFEVLLYDFFKKYANSFNCNAEIKLWNPVEEKMELNNHFFVFEHEKTFDSLIAVKKKKYYFRIKKDDGGFKYDSQGGYYIKIDSIKAAADLQYDLVKDLLDGNYDKHFWKKRLLDFKSKVESFDLDEESIVKYTALSKDVSEYGQVVINSKTGKPKVKKDGSVQYAPVPAHIPVAKRIIESGEELNIDDKVPYIIEESSPRNSAISLKEYRENPRYDIDYYWDSISSPIIEILEAVHPQDVYTFFGVCWNLTDKQLSNKISKMNLDDDYKSI